MKKRGSNHEDTIGELSFSPEGIVIGQPLCDFQGVLTGTPAYSGPASFTAKGTDVLGAAGQGAILAGQRGPHRQC